jgi:hypothetical protein
MEAPGGRGGIAPTHSQPWHQMGVSGRAGRALPPGKGPPVPIVQEAGWETEPVWTQRLEEKSSAPVGDGNIRAVLFSNFSGILRNFVGVPSV